MTFKSYRANQVEVDAAEIVFVLDFCPHDGVAAVKVRGGGRVFSVRVSVEPCVGDFLVWEPDGWSAGYIYPAGVFKNKYSEI